jgi:DNA adenine methylase
LVKSPLRYPGGKSRAVKLISTLVPPFEEFREPFVGGGSIFIYLKQVFPSKRFWINDLYENLFHFWQVCRDNPDKLIYQIWAWRNEFQEGKTLHRYLINHIDKFDNLKKAAAFFIFNRITFSGTTESGGFSTAAFEKRFTESSIERIKSLSGILSNTQITNEDYQPVVEKGGENVFIFLDPPYYSAKKSALYGKNGHLHKTFDHQRFASVMKTVKHHWLITYDDSPYIREIFSFAHIISWHLTYGMRNVRKKPHQIGEEIFISNYLPSDDQLSLI